ncbi:helix-turn-helix domain-containing protein [Collimonas fungivorans]|uniref:AraC family transcriptional regulator n=1 Tax=Collimonas fungivorans TaxID=158899 RepID=UPI0026F0A9C6|nr:helix-turn-helix transcriptional regulator [Collimonas fungivorans]
MSKATPPDLHNDAAEGNAVARHYPRGERIDPHSHAWGQVLFAVAGVMWVEVGREAFVVPPRRAVWIPAGTEHSIHMMSAVRMRNLYLPTRRTGHLNRRSDLFEVSGLLRELIIMIAEYQGRHDDAYLKAAYKLVLLELARAPRSSLRIPMPEASDRRLERLCRAVIENPSIAFGFAHYAENAGASVRTLSRLFRQQLGMGFAEWRRQVQLAVAMSRLAEGQPVSQIARSLGYLPSSFSDMFRRALGAAPGAYVASETLGATLAEGDDTALMPFTQ